MKKKMTKKEKDRKVFLVFVFTELVVVIDCVVSVLYVINNNLNFYGAALTILFILSFTYMLHTMGE